MKVINYEGKLIRISPETGYLEFSNNGTYWNFISHNNSNYGKVNELYVFKNQIIGLTDEWLVQSKDALNWNGITRLSSTNCGVFNDLIVNGDELLVFLSGRTWYSKDGVNWNCR